MKELDYYFSALFERLNNMEYLRYALLAATVSCLSYSIFAHGYHLYAAAIAALVFQIASWFLKTRIDRIRNIANEFHKLSMLTNAYGNVPSEFELSHLKASVSSGISNKVEKKMQNNEEASEYNLERTDSAREILMLMIHENSYWNHHLYKIIFIFLITIISGTFIGLLVTSLLAIPLVTADPEYTVPRLAFTFLSFSLIYEVLEKAMRSYRSSKIMIEIDNELSRSISNISEEHLLKIFNQYCEVKETAPNVPYFVYKSNRGKLNNGWNSRVNINGKSIA